VISLGFKISCTSTGGKPILFLKEFLNAVLDLCKAIDTLATTWDTFLFCHNKTKQTITIIKIIIPIVAPMLIAPVS